MTTISKQQAARVFGAALFSHSQQPNSFINMLTGAAPKKVKKDKNFNKGQTEKGAPVVMVTDLQSTAGDTVEVDLFHDLTELPVMGDEKAEGRGESLSKVSFEVSIDQGRKPVNAGGKMSQQRTAHDLLQVSKTMVGNYFNRLQDEVGMYQLAGARGYNQSSGMIVPLEDHAKFKKTVVNEILPPTYERHFFGGDATRLEDVEQSDILTLEKIDDLALYLEEMAHPIKPIQFEADQLHGEDPFYILWVTPRQWNDLWASTTEKKIHELQARAIKRGNNFKHPVFQGDYLMWRNILVRQYKKPVRFYKGSRVKVSKNDARATVTDVEVKVDIDRAILLGGQALACAYGKTKSGSQFGLSTKKVDHDNGREICIAWMNGMKKFRFEEKNGRINDYGVGVLDTAVNLSLR